ncbi:MAG TPA: aspartate/glutamate racemase family protein, partial [candidate division Zixibacteria bacterium]|nr:aspartate/glutamate racemase family protein [candidate division Zixibacteria bacterium]
MTRIGILGGMGPLATQYFINLLFAEIIAQRQPRTDQDWPDLTILIESSISDRTLCLASRDNSAALRINACLDRLLAEGCASVAVPCFTAHAMIRPELFNRGVLDIRECAVANLRPKEDLSLGVMATDGSVTSGIFSTPADRFTIIYPDTAHQTALANLLSDPHGIKSSASDISYCQSEFRRVMENLRAQGADRLV